jgi:hypothetical protein
LKIGRRLEKCGKKIHAEYSITSSAWEKGVFRSCPKFISSDSKNVTVEKRDGKQTTVELKLLRKFDQEYVERQLTPKTEIPKTDSQP